MRVKPEEIQWLTSWVTSLDKNIFMPAIWMWCKLNIHNIAILYTFTTFFLLFTSKINSFSAKFHFSILVMLLAREICGGWKGRRREWKRKYLEGVYLHLHEQKKVSPEIAQKENLSLFLSSWNRIHFFSPVPLWYCLPAFTLLKQQH